MPGKHRTRAKTRLGVAFAAVTAVAITAGTIGFGGASAAVPVSQGTGTFLGGSLVNTNLDDVAQLQHAAAQNFGGATVNDNHPLDATVLQGIDVDLGGGVGAVPLSDIIQLGVVNQFASASSDGSSRSASGTITDSGGVYTFDPPNGDQKAASLDLSRLLPASVTDTVANAGLSIGALGATASETSACDPTRAYDLAGVTFDLTSPAVAGVVGQLGSALNNQAVNAVINTLNATGLVSNVPDLGTVLNSVGKSLTSQDGNLTVDLTDGTISLNLDQIIQDSTAFTLNTLPPNTDITQYLVAEISSQLLPTLNNYVDDVLDELTTAIGDITVTGDILGIVPPILANLLSTVTSQLNTVTSGLGATVLSPLVSALTDNLLSLVVNKQSDSSGTYNETALAVSLPPTGDVATLNLASASTGPNDADCQAATATSIDPNHGPQAGGTSVTITGTDFVQGATSVTIGGTTVPPCSVPPAGTDADPCVTVNDDGTLLTFTTPAHAPGPVDVTVTTPNGTTAPLTYTYDPTAPAQPNPPVITSPADGSTVTDSTPPITGTADGPDGSTVTVTEGGTTICTATVSGGTWTCTPTTPLDNGDHTITAIQTVDGVDSPASAPVTFTVAATPNAPVITSPADGSTIADTTPPITGTADGPDGSTVTVTEGGTTICTATVSGGTWTCTPTTALSDGAHTITATQTVDGQTSDPSAPVTFTIDSSAPAVAAPVITSPADGSTTTDSTPPINGTGTPGADVTVTDENGATVCTATVQDDNTWTCTPTTPFTDGDHTITAIQTVDGIDSPASAPVTFTVDATPDAPVITSPADGSTVADSTPPITGTGTPGADVTVTEGGTTICTATVQDDGTWTCTPTTPLGDGDHTITATQTVDGVDSPASAPVTFTVDSSAPAVAAPVITSPADGSTTTDTTPAIKGTGTPGADVTVTDENGDTVCTATVQANGTWTCTPSTPLSTGEHTITAIETVGGVDSPASDPDNFTVAGAASTAPDAPVITSPTDGSTVDDPTPPITGTGTPGAAVTVTDENGDTVCTATVKDDGTWTCTPTTPLGDGDHTITATQTVDGHTSEPSAPVNFTVDTSAGPEIDGMTPVRGPVEGGTRVRIDGMNFVPGKTSVTIGGITVPADKVDVTVGATPNSVGYAAIGAAAAAPVAAADVVSYLEFVTPAHPEGPVDVTVTTPSGTSGPRTFTYYTDLVDAAPAPSDTSTSGGDLADTGTPTSFYLLLAASLIALGTVSTVAARRMS